MNIGIDARSLVEKKVGFGHFLENTLEAILEMDKDNKYFLFSDRDVVFDVEKYNNVKVVKYRDSFFLPKTFYYFFCLHDFIKKSGIILDVFWGTMHIMPKYLDKDTLKVLTIHDFTHIRYPASTTKYNLLISKLFFRPSIVAADAIACISNNTLNELNLFFRDECKGKDLLTVYGGGYKDTEAIALDYDYKNIKPELLYYKDKKIALFVGTIEPRKNVSLLIDAAPRLEGVVEMVVCGKIGWESKEVIGKLKKTKNLNYHDYINQDEKAFLMSIAYCQIQPSLYEGFGLPVVESMQAGSIVLVADNSSLRELVEMDELRFKTDEVDDFCKKLNELISNRELYRKAKIYCKIRGKQFSWNKTANEYLRIFSSML